MEAKKKTKVGRVVSDRMKKTVVVAVDSRKRHPLYGKLFRRTLKYKSHDEKGQCKMGDTVRIEESRPISKEKKWRVAEILQRGETAASE